MKNVIAAVVVGLAAISGAAHAEEAAGVNESRLLAMTTIGPATYAPRIRVEPAPVVSAPAAVSLSEEALSAVNEKLNRQLEQRLETALSAAE